jgi:hypothetical protein
MRPSPLEISQSSSATLPGSAEIDTDPSPVRAHGGEPSTDDDRAVAGAHVDPPGHGVEANRAVARHDSHVALEVDASHAAVPGGDLDPAGQLLGRHRAVARACLQVAPPGQRHEELRPQGAAAREGRDPSAHVGPPHLHVDPVAILGRRHLDLVHELLVLASLLDLDPHLAAVPRADLDGAVEGRHADRRGARHPERVLLAARVGVGSHVDDAGGQSHGGGNGQGQEPDLQPESASAGHEAGRARRP